MPRQIQRLNARQVASESRIGRHADGDGLYLSISANGGKRWVFLYRRGRKAQEMGLGSARTVSLATARKLAGEARHQLLEGNDPLGVRRKGNAGATFKECAAALIKAKRAGWRNAKHAAQWTSTFETYVYPVIGGLRVDEIEVGHVMKIVEPIWSRKTETASRVRSRIENVLDWAKAHGYRSGENPARWRGHLENLLPRKSKVSQVQHHPALPFSEIGNFMKELRSRQGFAAAALEFLILTAARTSEVIGATWNEIDPHTKIWTVPAERMKGGIAHRVPLSEPVTAVLTRMRSCAEEDAAFVFPGWKRGEPLSNNALLALLDRMQRSDLTSHGFRSTFRDWAGECTNFPNEVIEKALAHAIKDKTEAAYRRGDMLERRRALMASWGTYCDRPQTDVVIPLAQLDRDDQLAAGRAAAGAAGQ